MRIHFAALLALALSGCRGALPEAPAHAFVPAALAGPAPLQACWLEYARAESPGWAGTAGRSTSPAWHTTASGILLRHPGGHFLLDLGNSRELARDVADYDPLTWLYVKAVPGALPSTRPLPEVLASVGERADQLSGVLLSHAHLDHAGGLRDLPGVPALLPEEEIAFARAKAQEHFFGLPPTQAATLVARARPIAFAPRPYATFDQSFDLYGDGSVVLVRLSGHTPGSVGTFINLSPQKRLFHVGDAVDVREGYERRAGKSFLLSPTDGDRAAAEAVVSRLAQLHQADPALQILPAHDREAWAQAFGPEPSTCLGP